MNLSVKRLATVTASIKRSQFSEGKRSEPLLLFDNIKCTPFDPVDAKTRERLMLKTPHELLQTFTAGMYDIRRGDLLVLADVEYPIKHVSRWDARSDPFLHIFVEALQL